MMKLKKSDTVYVACKVDAVFIKGGFIQVSTRDCDQGFDAYEDEVLEPSEDCISRQAVLDMMNYGILEDNIKTMPPVTPQPKTGHWILKRTFPTKIYDEYLNEYKCSECYREIRCTESQLVNYPYCHCGARMVEPKKSEE